MNVYLESSAALRDILEAQHAHAIRDAVVAAENVIASRLTLTEVARRMSWLRLDDPAAAARVATREESWNAESELWQLHAIDDAVLARCRRRFPVEPVRTLDAIHLATAEIASSAAPDLVVLSTDERIRRNAIAFGLSVLP